MLHSFQPSVARVTITHRLVGGLAFVDRSSVVVGGRVHYPLWRTNLHYCGVHGVKIYRGTEEGDGASAGASQAALQRPSAVLQPLRTNSPPPPLHPPRSYGRRGALERRRGNRRVMSQSLPR